MKLSDEGSRSGAPREAEDGVDRLSDFSLNEHFEQEEGDDVALWEVQEILAEKNGKYLLRWVGTDNDGKPWPDSWAARRDVTDDLVEEWKIKKAKLQKEREQARKAKSASGRNKSVTSLDSITPLASRTKRSSSLFEDKLYEPHTTSPSSRTSISRTSSPEIIVHRSPKKRKHQIADELDADEIEGRSSSYAPRKRHRVAELSTPSESTVHSPAKHRKLNSINKATRHSTSVNTVLSHSVEEEEEVEEDVALIREKEAAKERRHAQHNKVQKKGRNKEGKSEIDESISSDTLSAPFAKRRSGLSSGPQPVASSSKASSVQNGAIRENSLDKTIRLQESRESSANRSTRELLSKAQGLVRNMKPKFPQESSAIASDKKLSRSRSPNQKSNSLLTTSNAQGIGEGTGPAENGADVRGIKALSEDTSLTLPFDNPNPLFLEDMNDYWMYSDDVDKNTQDISKLELEFTQDFSMDDKLQGALQKEDPIVSSDIANISSQVIDVQATKAANQSPTASITLETPLEYTSGSAESKQNSNLTQSLTSESSSTPRLDKPGQLDLPSETTKLPFNHIQQVPVMPPSIIEANLPALKPIASLSSSTLKAVLPNPQGKVPTSPIDSYSPEKSANERQHVDAENEQENEQETNGSTFEDDAMPNSFKLRARGLLLAEKNQQQRSKKLPLRKTLEAFVRPSSESKRDNDHDPIPSRPPSISCNILDDDVPVQTADESTSLARKRSNGEENRHVPGEIMKAIADISIVEEQTISTIQHDDVEIAFSTESNNADVKKGTRWRTPATNSSAPDDDELQSPTQRFKILGSPKKYGSNVIESPTRQLNSALGLLNAKSEEITDLKVRVAEGEDEKRELLERIAQLEADKVVMSQLARQDAAGGAESGSSISEDVGDNVGSNELEEKFQAVLNEKDGLLAEINLLKIARDDAEKNADIFRDLYNAASSFASELKSENVDLKSHLSLSEGQLKSGLPLIKSQYGVQLAKLKEELEQSQALVKLFSEKDRRTDDEVRQRAAKVPDYLALIDELRSEKQELKTERDTVLRQRNELLVENKDLGSQLSDERGRCEHMRDENLRLRVELARFGARERSVRKMMIHLNSPANYDSDAEGEPEDPGQEEFYVCHWARNEDPTARCGQHFTSKQDLQDHLFLVGHL